MRTERLLIGILLVVATLVAHRGHAQEFSNYDDDVYVTENPMVKYGLGSASLALAFREAHAANYHPLTWMSHMVDVELYDLDAGAHQRTSILLHALAAFLLFTFLAGATGSTVPSALVAGLFALHPQHVESVHWISERKDVLAACLWMLTLLAYARYARAPDVARYLLVALSLALGLLAKPTVVTLPAVLLLVDVWPLRRWRGTAADGEGPGFGRLALEKLPLLALVLGFSLVVLLAQTGARSDLETLPLAARASNAALATCAYVGTTLWPSGLALFYPHPAIVNAETYTPWSAGALGALVAIGLALVLGWRERRSRPWLTVGIAWFLGVLVPMVGLVQVGEQARADRYTYLAGIGLYLALVWTLWELAPRARRALAFAFLVVLGLLGAATQRQARLWASTVTIFEHTLRVTERNYVALNQLAEEARSRGDLARAEELLRAYEAIRADSHVLGNLAGVLAEREDWDEAERYGRRAVALDAMSPVAHNNLGIVFGSTGRTRRAKESFERAIALDPGYAEAWFNLGKLCLYLGEREDAVRAFEALWALDPRSAEARRLLEEARGS